MTKLIFWSLILSIGINIHGCYTQRPSTSKAIQNTILSLNDFPLDDVKDSGKRLMNLPLGLHRIGSPPFASSPSLELKSTSSPKKPYLILIHGYKSRGYEWIYALHTLSQIGSIFFYRWDWTQCPQPATDTLLKALTSFKQPLTLFGHSYGGVITALASRQYREKVSVNAHVIAAPLAGHSSLEKRCTFSIKDQLIRFSPSSTTQLTQWRTLHHLDGAFKSLKTDPQIITLSGKGQIHRLPDTYKGHRLGHNWSISWVVDQWVKMRTSIQK